MESWATEDVLSLWGDGAEVEEMQVESGEGLELEVEAGEGEEMERK